MDQTHNTIPANMVDDATQVVKALKANGESLPLEAGRDLHG